MKNLQKGFANVVLIALVVIIAGAVVYFVLVKKSPTPTIGTTAIPSLSADKKSISADGKVLLVIDNDAIFNWLKTKSQLCDEYNLTSSTESDTLSPDTVIGIFSRPTNTVNLLGSYTIPHQPLRVLYCIDDKHNTIRRET